MPVKPALLLVGMYLLFVVAVALVKPHWMPALPLEMRIYREPNGASGHLSLLALLTIGGEAGVDFPLNGIVALVSDDEGDTYREIWRIEN